MRIRWMQLVFIFLIGLQYGTESLEIANAPNSLLCCRELHDHELSSFSLALNYQIDRNKIPKNHCVALQQLLLVLSGSVEINPGPRLRKVKFPCGKCSKAVKNTDKSIACDDCNLWYYKECVSLGDPDF